MYIMCYFSILTKHTYEIFQKCISSHTSVACVAGGFCCVSQSKSYSRAKAESRTKKKTMEEEAREEGTFSFCAAESRDLLQVDFSYSSQVLKSERSKSLGITNQDKKNRTLESLLNLLLYESQKKKHTKKTPS